MLAVGGWWHSRLIATGLPRHSYVPEAGVVSVTSMVHPGGRERLATVASIGFANGACSLLALASPLLHFPLGYSCHPSAEISLDHARITFDISWNALGNFFAVIQDGNAVAQPHHELYIMLN